MKKKFVLPKALFTFLEWLGKVSFYNFNRAKNVVYERRIRYCDNPKLYLNVCYPENARKGAKLPVFVYIHGGGDFGRAGRKGGNRIKYRSRRLFLP